MDAGPGDVGGRCGLLRFAAGWAGNGFGHGGGVILAGELHRANGDYAQAFMRYQDLFRAVCSRKQKAALRFAGAFAPKSKFSLWLRNRIFNLMAFLGSQILPSGVTSPTESNFRITRRHLIIFKEIDGRRTAVLRKDVPDTGDRTSLASRIIVSSCS